MAGAFRSAKGEKAVRERYRELLADWPVPHEELSVPTRQGETFVIASGPADAPPVVLLHGTGINSVMWKTDVGPLSKHYRVYAVDLIGEPGLSAQNRPPFRSDAYALWLDDVFATLKVERPTLIGASLGGWMVLHYATKRPQRVARLVLLCPGGVGRFKLAFMLTAIPLMRCGRWGRRKAIKILLGVDLWKEGPEAVAFGDFMALVLKYFRPRTDPLPQFTDDELKRLTMPVLAILGGRDSIFNSADSKRRLESQVPQAQIIFLPEAGHGLMKQTDQIIDFLERTQDSA